MKGRGISLVGYRATGKTTVGRLLAERIGWDFADLDREVEAKAGQSVASIFQERGEAFFRDLEVEALKDLIGRNRLVIATGGGAILRAENRRELREFGVVAWLTAEESTLVRRLSRGSSRVDTRPPLTAAGTLAEVGTVLNARLPLYREVADFLIETDGRGSREVADDVLRAWQGDETNPREWQ